MLPNFESTHSPMINRQRRFPRIGLEYEFSVEDELLGRFTVTSVNLSFGGAFFETTKELVVGHIVQIEMIKNGQVSSTEGRIVHRHKTGYGVAFIDPSADFQNNLCEVIFAHVVKNVRQGAPEDTVPARIALFSDSKAGYQLYFTTHLNPHGVWVLTDQRQMVDDIIWITLPEHGLFDCKAKVVWCTRSAMGLEFVDPSKEFAHAYERLFNSFLSL